MIASMGRSASAAVAALAAVCVALGQQGPQPPAPAASPARAPEQPQPAPAEAPQTAPAQPAPEAAPAQPGPEPVTDELPESIVILKDGQRYEGLLVERTEDAVILKIAGILTTIPASRVQRVIVMAPVLERYRAMRAAIDDQDADSLVRLAEWLRSRSQWDAALTELDHVLRIQPASPEARRLKVLVESQKALAEKSRKGKPPPAATGPTGPAPAAPPGREGFPLLSDAEISLIKVYEVDLADPPRMTIERSAIRRLIEGHPGDPLIPSTPEGRDALYRLSPARILDIMFRLQARDLYPEVRVIDEPRSMRLFRDNVHRVWIQNSCATTRCHGGSEAGRLMLYNQRPNTDATVYTNFLILDRFRLADGKPLINYDDPASSALLQFGLPREIATRKHPDVPGSEGRGDLWRPFFKSPEDRRFQEAVQWIKSMYRPRPEYPVQYTPPSAAPAAPAATAPVPR